MKILITYDVSQRHTEVKQGMLQRGFFDCWQKDNIFYNLPNTTLWHPNLPDAQTAIDIFNEVIAQLNANRHERDIIVVERLIAVDFNSSAGIPGNPHA